MTIEMTNREKQIDKLIEALEKTIKILRHDKSYQWTRHFSTCLQDAKELQNKGFNQEELNQLSATIMSVYGGAGSFNDYAPSTFSKDTGKVTVIQGMEELSHWSKLVYQYAVELRVTEIP